MENRAYVAVIGEDVAKGLFGLEEPLEKEINVDGRNWRVIGVYEKPTGSTEPDERVTVPYWTLSGDRPSLALVEPTDGPLVLVAPGGVSTGDLRGALEALADELLVDVELADAPAEPEVVEPAVEAFKAKVAAHPDLALLDEDSRDEVARVLGDRMSGELHQQFNDLTAMLGELNSRKVPDKIEGPQLEALRDEFGPLAEVAAAAHATGCVEGLFHAFMERTIEGLDHAVPFEVAFGDHVADDGVLQGDGRGRTARKARARPRARHTGSRRANSAC